MSDPDTAVSEAVRGIGGCGVVSPDGDNVCIKTPGECPPHGWDNQAAAPRVFAFAKALGLTVEHMVALLESYDLHLLSGPAMRAEIDTYKTRSALEAARTFITCHPAVHGDWPILVGLIDSALARAGGSST